MRFDWCRVKPDAPANSDPTAVQCTASSLFSSPRQSSPPKDPRQVNRTMTGGAIILIRAGEAPTPTCWGTSRTRQMGWAPPASSSSLTGRSSWTCFFPSPGSPWQGCQGRWNHLYEWCYLCTVGRFWKKPLALGFFSTFPLRTLQSLSWTRFLHVSLLCLKQSFWKSLQAEPRTRGANYVFMIEAVAQDEVEIIAICTYSGCRQVLPKQSKVSRGSSA